MNSMNVLSTNARCFRVHECAKIDNGCWAPLTPIRNDLGSFRDRCYAGWRDLFLVTWLIHSWIHHGHFSSIHPIQFFQAIFMTWYAFNLVVFSSIDRSLHQFLRQLMDENGWKFIRYEKTHLQIILIFLCTYLNLILTFIFYWNNLFAGWNKQEVRWFFIRASG